MSIRPFSLDDMDRLVDICIDTWITPSEYGDRLLREMSEYYILGVWAESEACIVYSIEEEPVGFIFIGRRPCTPDEGLLERRGSLSSVLMDDPDGRRLVGDISFFDREHDILFSRFDGPEWELKLIMVGREHRMMGIGRSLIEHAACMLDVHEMLLYTDDDCDCAFYDRFDHCIMATNRFELDGRSGCSYAYVIRM